MASRRASRAPPSRGARETRSARKRRCSDDDRLYTCIPLFSVGWRDRVLRLTLCFARVAVVAECGNRSAATPTVVHARAAGVRFVSESCEKNMEWGTALASLQQQHPPPQRQPEQQSPSKNDLSRWDAVLQSFFEFSASPPPPAPPPPTQPGDEEAGSTSEGDALRSSSWRSPADVLRLLTVGTYTAHRHCLCH